MLVLFSVLIIGLVCFHRVYDLCLACRDLSCGSNAFKSFSAFNYFAFACVHAGNCSSSALDLCLYLVVSRTVEVVFLLVYDITYSSYRDRDKEHEHAQYRKRIGIE